MSENDLSECLSRLDGGASDHIDYNQLLRDSVLLLTSPEFSIQTAEWQSRAIVTIFRRMISSLHAQSGVVASLAAPHFLRLLRDPQITLPQACLMHESLWGMWWCAASSLDDMRPIQQNACLPFHHFLERRGMGMEPIPADRGEGPIRVAYLSHYSHGAQGNAVGPLVASLARAHAAIHDREVFVYAVQWVDDAWLSDQFWESRVRVRNIRQDNDYDRLDELFDRLRADKVDVVITDITSSIASVLFARRVARAQVRLDLGLPYWCPPSLDLVLLSGKRWRDAYPYGQDRAAEISTTQELDFIFRMPAEAEIREARASLPEGAQVIGIFTRLIKITPSYLSLIRSVLLRRPGVHFLVGGTGDPRLLYEFMAAPELAGRITFLHRNVNLAVYAHAIDLFVDTFPFIGGLACREIVAQGVPIFSLRSNEWSLKQEQDRDPASIANDEQGLLLLIDRALSEPEFHRACAAAATATIGAISDVDTSASEIDAAVVSVLRRNRQ